eukprot:TRINITY_DN7138_c0_g2_i2.p5 TRINITY_DN7138_c0_g2~~TRINITY_DN7138_c0_g2_i2.p5  ORF type:complete len:160 (-),score=5.29 TRINITY_DN7138_c0_g2_i2:23-502(-)
MFFFCKMRVLIRGKKSRDPVSFFFLRITKINKQIVALKKNLIGTLAVICRFNDSYSFLLAIFSPQYIKITYIKQTYVMYLTHINNFRQKVFLGRNETKTEGIRDKRLKKIIEIICFRQLQQQLRNKYVQMCMQVVVFWNGGYIEVVSDHIITSVKQYYI